MTPEAAPTRGDRSKVRPGFGLFGSTAPMAIFLVVTVFLTAVLGIALTRQSGRIATIWLANAVVLLVLLKMPRRGWGGWLLCGLVGNLAADRVMGDAHGVAVILALCNTVEILLVAGLFRVWDHYPRPNLTRMASLFKFVCVGGVLGPCVSAAIGALVLHADQGVRFWTAFSTWFSADALGLLIIVPMFAGATREDLRRVAHGLMRLETLAMLCLIPAITVAIILLDQFPLIFLLGPLLLWAVLRLGFMGATVAIFLATAFAIGTLATQAPNPEVALHLRGKIEFLQLFFATNVLLFLPIANLLHSLEESSARLGLATASGRLGIWALDFRTSQMTWNDEMFDLYGYSRKTRTASLDLWETSLHPEDAASTQEAFTAAMRGDKEFSPEFRVVHPDGSIKHIKANAIFIRDEQGSPLRVIGLNQDISDRKEAEEQAWESRDMLRQVLENFPGVVFWKDPELVYMGCNKSFALAAGVSQPTGLIGKTDLDLPWARTEALAYQEADRKVLENLTPRLGILETQVQADGATVWFETNKVPFFNSKGKLLGLLGTAQDVTARQQNQQNLERKTQELLRSNAELEQFAYVASHDLQEPLRMVSSYTQLLARRYAGKLDQDADDFIAFAVDGVKRMQQLINALLAYSRAGGKGNLLNPFDLKVAVEGARANLTASFEESGATFTHDPLPTILGDPTTLTQLLQNLLSNALKFRGVEAPRIHLGVHRRKGDWVLSVKDNGLGIAREHFDRIFLIFQRLHGRSEYPGTGIGLALCKRIVEHHGGEIWVESEPGQGSTFLFTLPSMQEVLLSKNSFFQTMEQVTHELDPECH